MKILRVKREEATITTTVEKHVHEADRIVTEESKEAPLPGFDHCLQVMQDVIIEMMEEPASWADQCRILGISLYYTEAGTRSCVVSFDRPFALAGKRRTKFKTPRFRFDDPQGSESGLRECSSGLADIINDFLVHAEDYINGQRSQTLLPINTAEPDDGAADGEELPFRDENVNLTEVRQRIKSATKKTDVFAIVLDHTGERMPPENAKLPLPDLKSAAINFILSLEGL